MLKLLHSSSSVGERPDAKRHCFHSHLGQVALFLETDATSQDALRKQVAAFEYDLQLQTDGQDEDPWEGKI